MSTIVMPDGGRYRISSTRRYIVVCLLSDERWHPTKRSDNLQTALTEWRAAGRRGATVNVIDAKAPDGPVIVR